MAGPRYFSGVNEARIEGSDADCGDVQDLISCIQIDTDEMLTLQILYVAKLREYIERACYGWLSAHALIKHSPGEFYDCLQGQLLVFGQIVAL